MKNSFLLQTSQLSKQFGGVKAVDSVSLDLEEGELLGIIGPNGSGKTTLVNLITGFVSPDSGHGPLSREGYYGADAPYHHGLRNR